MKFLAIIGTAAVVVFGLGFWVLQRGGRAEPVSVEPVELLSSVDNRKPPTSLAVESPRTAVVRETVPEPSTAPISPHSEFDPRTLLGDSSAFRGAHELEFDPRVNPKGLKLTREQRARLRALLQEAELAVTAANQALQSVNDAHARSMIDQGLGWDVPAGDVARSRDSSHTTLFSSFTPDKGTRAISFDCSTEPETKAAWEAKNKCVSDYSLKIKAFFEPQ